MAVDKKANFIRIAESRLNKILKSISSLSNLSNKSYYDYSQEQINDLFDSIQSELDATRKLFEQDSRKKIRL